MNPVSEREIKEAIEFVRDEMADPAKFERWANELLDKAVAHNVERKRGR